MAPGVVGAEAAGEIRRELLLGGGRLLFAAAYSGPRLDWLTPVPGTRDDDRFGGTIGWGGSSPYLYAL